MKLREEEFYYQYHQHGGTTIIPTEIFNELYDDATEEIERLNNIINEFEEWLNNIPNYFMDRRSNNTGVYVQKGMQQMIDMCNNKLQELKGSDKE